MGGSSVPNARAFSLLRGARRSLRVIGLIRALWILLASLARVFCFAQVARPLSSFQLSRFKRASLHHAASCLFVAGVLVSWSSVGGTRNCDLLYRSPGVFVAVDAIPGWRGSIQNCVYDRAQFAGRYIGCAQFVSFVWRSGRLMRLTSLVRAMPKCRTRRS